MRKTENALVAAIQSGDADRALDLLQVLVTLDRRRAWWALFRSAADQSPASRRDAMIALVGRTYIARRKGELVGVDDGQVLCTLTAWLLAKVWESPKTVWAEDDCALLRDWLPKRLRPILGASNSGPPVQGD